MNAPFWHGRRVLVTGHTGFKGSWLSLLLVHLGAEVIGLSDAIPTTPSLYEAASVDDSVAWVKADVRDAAAVGRALLEHEPEVVFHLAAQSLVRRSLAEPVRTFETNVLGTVNVLEAIRGGEGVRAAVVVTSDKVYEPVAGRRHVETDPLGGRDPYSGSKACAELVTHAYRASFFADGPPVASARAGNVIGGGDWSEDRLVPDVVKALAAGRPVEIRYPQAVRPWQHVLDALEGYLLLAERLWDDRDCAGGWNFGPEDAEGRTVEWVVRRLGEYWGAPVSVRQPRDAQPPETPTLELDARRARDVLGWRPRWDVEQALRATADWYRLHAGGEDGRALTDGQIAAFTANLEPSPAAR